MKIKPQRWVKNLLVLPLLWSFILSSIQIDITQATPPIEPFYPENSRSAILNNYFQADDGKYFTNDSHHAWGTTQTRQAAGGPDEFGYTWKRVNTFDWIDDSGGINTGIDRTNVHSGKIDLGFNFRYYGNTYTGIYISRHGFVSFNDHDLTRSQSHIPSPELPNDVIAPHWVPSDDINYVKYQCGGFAPNRWFVVEWNQFLSTALDAFGNPNSVYTFELILFENGDIHFQYKNMLPGDRRFCEASGIENSDGLDGLTITSLCDPIDSNHAIHITEPELFLGPIGLGAFFTPGKTEGFSLTIINMGEHAIDNYHIGINSIWQADLFEEDGLTSLLSPIRLEKKEYKKFLVRVTAPASASIGGEDWIAPSAVYCGQGFGCFQIEQIILTL